MATPAMEEGLEEELLPCQICGRTFLPRPLRTHLRVCEKNATKKRKVFNSLKQRIEGTDLVEFHKTAFLKPTLAVTDPAPGTAPAATRSKWKEKHEQLVQAIKAAKGDSPVAATTTTSSKTKGGGGAARRSTGAVGTMGVTERCPSCDRQFGPKAFDRHVEWCRERASHVQRSPAAGQERLVARERLEARTKYRVPPLGKSRRSITRDKYSPAAGGGTGGSAHMGSRTESMVSVRSSASVPSIRPQPHHRPAPLVATVPQASPPPSLDRASTPSLTTASPCLDDVSFQLNAAHANLDLSLHGHNIAHRDNSHNITQCASNPGSLSNTAYIKRKVNKTNKHHSSETKENTHVKKTTNTIKSEENENVVSSDQVWEIAEKEFLQSVKKKTGIHRNQTSTPHQQSSHFNKLKLRDEKADNSSVYFSDISPRGDHSTVSSGIDKQDVQQTPIHVNVYFGNKNGNDEIACDCFMSPLDKLISSCTVSNSCQLIINMNPEQTNESCDENSTIASGECELEIELFGSEMLDNDIRRLRKTNKHLLRSQQVVFQGQQCVAMITDLLSTNHVNSINIALPHDAEPDPRGCQIGVHPKPTVFVKPSKKTEADQEYIQEEISINKGSTKKCNLNSDNDLVSTESSKPQMPRVFVKRKKKSKFVQDYDPDESICNELNNERNNNRNKTSFSFPKLETESIFDNKIITKSETKETVTHLPKINHIDNTENISKKCNFWESQSKSNISSSKQSDDNENKETHPKLKRGSTFVKLSPVERRSEMGDKETDTETARSASDSELPLTFICSPKIKKYNFPNHSFYVSSISCSN